MSVKSSGKPPEKSPFTLALIRHLGGGTRPNGASRGWRDEEFAQAVPSLGQAQTAVKNVRNWRDGTIPYQRYIEPILTALFGADLNNSERVALKELWEEARRRSPPPATDPVEPPAGEAAGDPDLPATASDWQVDDPAITRPGLAYLRLHPPPRSNTPETWLAQVSLSFGRTRFRVDRLTVEAGLKTATLAESCERCGPAQESCLGETTDHPNLAYRAGIWTVQGPVKAGGLDGNPLGRAALFTIEQTQDGAPSVSLTFSSLDTDIAFTFADPGQQLSADQEAILKRFLQLCQLTGEETEVVWAKATMHRKPSA